MSTMLKLPELLRAINTLAQVGGSAQQYEALADNAGKLAANVHWAEGQIDPEGHWLNRLAALQDDLQLIQVQTGNAAIKELNDRLTQLGIAIAKHDSDLATGHRDVDEGEDFS